MHRFVKFDVGSLFIQLNSVLILQFAGCSSLQLSKKTTQLPQLPAKTWFKSFEPEFIEQRRKELEVYMQSMLNTRAVVNAREFHQFLGLTENASGI
jgi:hypothetical protein